MRFLCSCLIASSGLVFVSMSLAQEINWYSIDHGGGTSSANDITILGVIGQVDVGRMEAASITVSSGFLPMPADLIFKSKFGFNGGG